MVRVVMNYLKLYRSITILSSLVVMGGLIFSNFSPMHSSQVVFAQQTVKAPETVEEAQAFGINILKALPEAIKRVWHEDVLPLWHKMWDRTQNCWKTIISPQIAKGVSWMSDIWYQGIKPKIQSVLDKIRNFLGQEIEKRKPVIEQEFEKGKQEIRENIKQEVPKVSKGLWERLKDLIW